MSSHSEHHEARILVARFENIVAIRIIGRATFKVGQELRDYGTAAMRDDIASVIMDLSQCTAVDSTILGVIAMIGLEGHRRAEVVIVNANECVRSTMNSVGLTRLCRFTEQELGEADWDTLCQAAVGAVTMDNVAETVLNAHKTLMDLDPENVPKFRDVVEMLHQELAENA